MASTYFTGLMSGIDTASIVSQLMALERQPLETLLGNIDYAEQRKEVYGELNTDLLALKDLVKELDASWDFDVLKATSSDEDLLSATVSENASAGSYSFTVVNMASRGMDASNTYASDTTLIGAGNIDISLDGVLQGTVTLDAADTLTTAAQKINDAELGVNAFVLNDGTGYRLMVQSNDTGVENDVEVATDVPGLSFSTVSQAQDAEIQFGETTPITITSSTNVFEDVVPNVTFTINAEPAAPTAVNVVVERDVETLAMQITDIMDKYNEAVKTVEKYSNYDSDTNKKGLLFGDTTVRMMMDDLTNIVMSTVGAVTGDYDSLMAIGVTIADGLLSVDQDVLTNALTTAPEDVITLFTDATEGISVRLNERLDFITAYGSGVIYTQQNSIDERISYMEDRADSMEEMLANREEMYRRQFQAMEEAIATLQSQSQFLSTQLGGASGMNSMLGA